jgi:hypothetical protein
MVKKLTAILASAAIFAAVASYAAPDGKKKAAASNPKCPDCKMVLASAKSAKTPTAVKIGKKTYYCCDHCPMGKKKPAAHSGAKKK